MTNAPDVLRLAYRIEGMELPGGISTSRVAFETQIGAQTEVVSPASNISQRPRTTGAAAVRAWLAEQLADGPQDSAKLKAAAAAAGVSIPSLYRTAHALGVIREPIDGTPRKSWRLP